MAKDVKINIKTTGAKEAQQDVKNLGNSAQSAGQQINDGGKAGAGGMNELDGAVGKGKGGVDGLNKSVVEAVGSIGQWAAGMVSVSAAIALINKGIHEQIQLMEEQGKKAAEQTQALVKLQLIGQFGQEAPDLRQRVMAISNTFGKDYGDVIDAFYNIKSKNPTLNADQLTNLLTESAELNLTSPESSLTSITDMMTLYAKKSGDTDYNKVQNVLNQTITEAGSSLQEVGQYMPEFLPVGVSGGLSPAQTAAIWAYATGQLGSTSKATTSLTATFMGLQGKGTPESQELLASLGVSPGTGFLDQLKQLKTASDEGRFGLKEAETFAGREGQAMLLSLIQNPEALMQTIANVEAADRSDIDITAKSIADLFFSDPMAAEEFELRKSQTQQENIDANSPDALKRARVWEQYKAYRAARGQGGFKRFLSSTFYKSHGWAMSADALEDYLIANEPSFGDFIDDGILNDSDPGYELRGGGMQRHPSLSDDEKAAFNRRLVGGERTPTVNNITNINYFRDNEPTRPRVSPEDID